MGIRKAQSSASAALRRSFIAVQVCGESVPVKPEEIYIKTALKKNQNLYSTYKQQEEDQETASKKSNRTMLPLLSQTCM